MEQNRNSSDIYIYQQLRTSLWFVLAIAMMFNFAFVGNSEAQTTWPDTTTITWDETETIAFESLVWCLLEVGYVKSTILQFVDSLSHTVWQFDDSTSGPIHILIVDVGEDDISLKAPIYEANSQVRVASPIILEFDVEQEWPLDDRFEEQNYLNNINWHDILESNPELRGSEHIRIGVLDSGIHSYYATPPVDLKHPDLDGERFHSIKDYFFNQDFPYDSTGHGTAVVSLIAANAGNEGPDEEENWGMVGVNTISPVYIGKVTSVRVGNAQYSAQIFCTALIDIQQRYNCDVINISLGWFRPYPVFEETFAMLIEEEIMPLLVCATGNEGSDYGVHYPARYAYWGTLEGYERGYTDIISVGALNISTGDAAYFSSYTPNYHHVSVIAPGLKYFGGILVANRPTEEELFRGASGTSLAAPLVTGLASLIMSKDAEENEGNRTLSNAEIRRIIELTSNCQENADRVGYGIVNVELALSDLEYERFDLEGEQWYWLSSPIKPGVSSLSSILKDLKLEGDDIYYQRIDKFKGYNPTLGEELLIDPDEEIYDFVIWNWHNMYKIKLKELTIGETDSLIFVGKRMPIDTSIPLYDDNQVNGWNWVAYFPDYEAPATYALESIAESGNNGSPLFLAKGEDGSFYAVHYGFSNLTMYPGKGYELQIVSNQTEELTYPVEEPELLQKERTSSEPQLYTYKKTADFMPVLITDIEIPNATIEVGFEIGAFYENTCIGSVVYNGNLPIGLAAWKDDQTTNETNGYVNIEGVSFRVIDPNTLTEYFQPYISTASEVSDLVNESILVSSLVFDGERKNDILPVEFSLSSPYPNPFNSKSMVNFSLNEQGATKLKLFDLQGRVVMNLIEENLTVGEYKLSIDAAKLTSGVYYLQLESGKNIQTKQLGVIK